MPNSIQKNFQLEIKKHYGKFFKVNNITKKTQHVKQGFLNLIPFSVLSAFSEDTSIDFDIFIADEAHVARNNKTQIYTYFKALANASSYTWLLTGTPIVNYKCDLSSLLSLKDDSVCKVLRTCKKEVLDLPEIQYLKHLVDDHAPTAYNSHFRLAQITEERVHSCFNVEKWKHIKSLRDTGENVLVFMSFKDALFELMTYLDTTLTINGDMSMAQRYKNIDTFQKDGGVIICTYDAAGVGINLTNAHHVCCVDPAWNPSKINQAVDRVHRYGLEHEVKVHIYMQPNERWIYSLVNCKEALIEEELEIEERLPLEDVKTTYSSVSSIPVKQTLHISDTAVVKPIRPTIVKPVGTTIVKPIRTTIVKPIRTTIVKPIRPTIVKPIRPTIVKPIRPTIVRPTGLLGLPRPVDVC